MKINRNLVLQENNFSLLTGNKTFLIRLLFDRLSEITKDNTLMIAFKDIRKEFGTDIRQKFVNELLDDITDTTFTYDTEEYKYIESYTNHFADRYYSIVIPKETISVWLKDALVYDFNILKDLKTNKYSMILYEYLLTGVDTLPLYKLYDIFNKDGYNFYDKKRELDKAINIINHYSDIRATITYSRSLDTFIIT